MQAWNNLQDAVKEEIAMLRSAVTEVDERLEIAAQEYEEVQRIHLGKLSHLNMQRADMLKQLRLRGDNVDDLL